MPPSCMNMIVEKLEAWKTHGLVMAMCKTSFEGGVLDQTNSLWWENLFGRVEVELRREEGKKIQKEGRKEERKKKRKKKKEIRK